TNVCSRFGTVQKLTGFAGLFGIRPEDMPAPPEKCPEEAAPTDPIAAVLRNPKSNDIRLEYLKWGLIPNWEEDLRSGVKRINARAETIHKLPSFREAFKKRRCILPLAYFYEYDATSKYIIKMADESEMGIAGLWE